MIWWCFIGGKWVHISDWILVMSRDFYARDTQENHLIMIPLKILFVIHDLVVFYWRKMSHLSFSILVISRDFYAWDMQENHLIMIPLTVLFVNHDLVEFYCVKMRTSQWLNVGHESWFLCIRYTRESPTHDSIENFVCYSWFGGVLLGINEDISVTQFGYWSWF